LAWIGVGSVMFMLPRADNVVGLRRRSVNDAVIAS
jgi:hypothetical protein